MTQPYRFIGVGPGRYTPGKVYKLEVVEQGPVIQISQPGGFLSPFYDPKIWRYADRATFNNNWKLVDGD